MRSLDAVIGAVLNWLSRAMDKLRRGDSWDGAMGDMSEARRTRDAIQRRR